MELLVLIWPCLKDYTQYIFSLTDNKVRDDFARWEFSHDYIKESWEMKSLQSMTNNIKVESFIL